MTPQEIETAARRQYNAVGDTNWSQLEIFDVIYRGSLEMALECLLLEQIYTTTTTAGQQDYTYPTNTIAIKRVTHNGDKLELINMREYDSVTLNNSASTTSGTPQYYTVWNNIISLFPIPDTAYTLKIYSINQPAQITAATTAMEIPALFHVDIIYYVLSEMAAKDQNFKMAQYYLEKWEAGKIKAKMWAVKRRRRDSFSTVLDEESLPRTVIGVL